MRTAHYGINKIAEKVYGRQRKTSAFKNEEALSFREGRGAVNPSSRQRLSVGISEIFQVFGIRQCTL